jgi:hypothetical protein
MADVAVTVRADERLEKIVARLGVDPRVSAVSWKAVPTVRPPAQPLPAGKVSNPRYGV